MPRIKQENRDVLKYANNVMHDLLKNDEIFFVVKHDKEDPTKFTVVSDSMYADEDNDTNPNGIEGVKLTFADPEDFKTHFPELIPPEFVKNDDTIRIKDNQRKEYYPVSVRSIPKVDVNINPTFAAENVMSDELETIWAVKQIGARLLLDYGKDIDIGTLWIAWARGDQRQFKFTVAYAKDAEVTKESKKFHVIPYLENVYSSGKTGELESYNLVKRKDDPLLKTRYIVIQVNGNTMTANKEWAAIARVEVTSNISVKTSETKKLLFKE